MIGLETMKRRRPTPCASSSAGSRSVIASPIQIADSRDPVSTSMRMASAVSGLKAHGS